MPQVNHIIEGKMQRILSLVLAGSLLIQGLLIVGPIGGHAVVPLQNQGYFIITSNELVESLESLKSWKEYLGYSVEIVTVEWISTNFQGDDLQEKIKSCLIKKYRENGIRYVLLVGSRSVIPMRTCYPILLLLQFSSYFFWNSTVLFYHFYHRKINKENY